MNRRIATTVAAALYAVSVAASAQQQIEVSLHDNAAEGRLLFPAATVGELESGYRGIGAYFNNEGDFVASGFVHMLGAPYPGYSPVQWGAGAKVYGFLLDESGKTVSAAAVGGSAQLYIPAEVPQRVAFTLHVAPNITTFGDASRVFEALARYAFDLTPQSHAFIGYRYLKVHLSGHSNETLDNNLHLGVRVDF